MSVFSKIKNSRKAAKEHQAQMAQKEKEEAKVPYKHIPTHAAVDALSGAPSSWKHEDRPKIKEHHKRRSQMAISRTVSTLSTTSFMHAAGSSSDIPPLPRNSSYSAVNPTWYDRTGDLNYSSDFKGKGPRSVRHHSYQDSGIGGSIGPSPLASHVVSERTSPVNSSGNSTTSSSDNLEMAMAPEHPVQESQNTDRPQPTTYVEKDIFQRLHTSTTRKIGEAPIMDSVPVKAQVTATVVAQEQKEKPKKARWSLMGKRTSIAAA